MSSSLVWQLVRENSSFLVKRGRNPRQGSVQFTSEPGNLMNVNSAKFSGLCNASTVHVASDLTFATKDGKNTNKPKAASFDRLFFHFGKSKSKVSAAVKSVRPDLAKAATLRFTKAAKGIRVKRGLSKKALKSTRRGKL